MKTKIELTDINFPDIQQEIIDSYYLQPFKSKKVNIKDGYIEREVHGAMHATRATIWAMMIHQFIKKIVPTYVNSSLETIANFFKLEIPTIERLIFLTMTCHDTGREGEGRDNWEKQSSEICEKFLIENIKLDKKQAKLIANAIFYKDNKLGFNTFLTKEFSITEPDLKHFDYIRQLINLGDNLDLVRCVGSFNVDYIFKTFSLMDEFDVSAHKEEILNFIIAIHNYVYNQHDMLFACNVMDENKLITTKNSHFSNQEKVKYEHADNIFTLMFKKLSEHPTFKNYLSDYQINGQSEKYSGDFKFDPFIHGTNTSIFATMHKTEFQMMSILKMMNKYHCAPMTGEIKLGGYDTCLDIIENDPTGNTCFAKMEGETYSLEKVLSSYTSLPTVSSDIDAINQLKSEINYANKYAYSNLNILLIALTRAKQFCGQFDSELANNIEQLKENLKASVQFFYLIQILGFYIRPNLELLSKFPSYSSEKISIDNICKYSSHFTFEYFLQKIIENKINMEEILNDPSEENLQKVLSLLEYPKNYFKENADGKLFPEHVSDSITQFFCIKKNQTLNYPLINSSDFHNVKTNGSYRSTITEVFYDILSEHNYYDENYYPFNRMIASCKQYLISFNDRIRLLNELLEKKSINFEITNNEKYFLKNRYPLILISENEEKIQLFDFQKSEYRSKEFIKIGKDIKMLATDTHEHRLEIMKYLENNHFNHIKVVLFDDLKQSKITHEYPKEPYHHEDGVPKLQWLASKKLASTCKDINLKDNSFFKNKTTNAPSSLQHIIKDGIDYDSIRFD